MRWMILKAFVFLFYLVISGVALCQISPFSTPASERIRIDILSSPDWVQVDHIDGPPETLSVALSDGSGGCVHIDSFVQEGAATPALVSVFKVGPKKHSRLFLIVKWHYYLPGVSTEGDFYEVHAYSMSSNKAIEDRRLSKMFGSGFDGVKDGVISRFQYKDAESIRYVIRGGRISFD